MGLSSLTWPKLQVIGWPKVWEPYGSPTLSLCPRCMLLGESRLDVTCKRVGREEQIAQILFRCSQFSPLLTPLLKHRIYATYIVLDYGISCLKSQVWQVTISAILNILLNSMASRVCLGQYYKTSFNVSLTYPDTSSFFPYFKIFPGLWNSLVTARQFKSTLVNAKAGDHFLFCFVFFYNSGSSLFNWSQNLFFFYFILFYCPG